MAMRNFLNRTEILRTDEQVKVTTITVNCMFHTEEADQINI